MLPRAERFEYIIFINYGTAKDGQSKGFSRLLFFQNISPFLIGSNPPANSSKPTGLSNGFS